MWFIYALIATLSWGCADLFYKKGTDENDRYSHLKIAVWVGLVMGVCAFALLPLAESGTSVLNLINLVNYAPVSLAYILSMVIGYAGMRYLEVSIISPVQNASGAFSSLVMILYFVAVGRIGAIADEFTVLDLVGTSVIAVGIILLAIVEKRKKIILTDEKKYHLGALALIFPLLYCLIDTIGTAADGIVLDEKTGLGLGEFDIIILYGLTFFLAGIFSWLFLLIKEKHAYNPFKEGTKGIAAAFEEFGQLFYVFAMAKQPVLVAPMVASYCIVSVILSRLFLKEKLTREQYLCITMVILGIVALGVAEGLAEG